MPRKNSSRKARPRASRTKRTIADVPQPAEQLADDDLWSALATAEPGDESGLLDLRRRVEELAPSASQDGTGNSETDVSRCLDALDACLSAELDSPTSSEAAASLAAAACRLQQSLQSPLAEASPSELPQGATETACAGAAPADERNAEAPSSLGALYDPELFAGFIAESSEHLDQAESHLLVLESEPRRQESLSAVFRAFHSIKGTAGFLELADVVGFAHEAENLLDLARSGTIDLQDRAFELALSSVDVLKAQIARYRDDPAGDEPPATRQSREALLQALRTFTDATQSVDPQAGERSRQEEAPPATQNLSVEPPSAALASPAPQNGGTSSGKPEAASKEAVKVDRDRLDRLIDMIGELVIAESMVHQEFGACAASINGGRNLAQLNKITRNLQEMSLSLRMVPVRATFQKMARLARDLAKKVGKQVDLQVEGEDTELDKTVVDQIGDPLMHMVRNAIDHGLEPSGEDRAKNGKPARGRVTLRAFHRGGNIYIETEDDGRGLDREKILDKARRQGLVAADANLSEAEVFDLIFQPGFSTAEKVTDVSGRGVGMDVVRRNVQSLRGTIELKSQLGRGTCCSMRLPLTLAIIDGLVVRVSDQRFILPTLSIVELLRLDASQIRTVKCASEFFTVRNRHLPLLRVESLFGSEARAASAGEGIVVVIEDREAMAGLFVDEVLGQQQAVIKRLGKGLEDRPGLAGGAIMPDGKVGLILDVHGLLGMARGEEAAGR